jgi:hypothetical protein
MKDKYDKLVKDSAVSWHKLYTEEKDKRKKLEERYRELTKILRKQGKDKVNKYYNKLGELAKDSGEDWDEERTDIIGQNGNDGTHYEAEFGMMMDEYGDDKEGM